MIVIVTVIENDSGAVNDIDAVSAMEKCEIEIEIESERSILIVPMFV